MIFITVFLFSNIVACWWVPFLAAMLDAALGDPHRWPHPVRLIGKLCERVEPIARQMLASEFLAGLIAVGCVLLATWLPVRLLLLLPYALTTAIATYLGFAGLALGQLLREGKAASALLEKGDVEAARAAVGMLVSRDLSQAGIDDLCRALAETLAENYNDAFVAPLFWFALGGPVALWLYKAVSTMDSMWGYPHAPWTRFGTTAAVLDDALAFVPARISLVALFLAALCRAKLPGRLGQKPGPLLWPGFTRVMQDAHKMKSPNAGWPMAACAWLHGASMGGPTVYAGAVVQKPTLGPVGVTWTPEKCADLCRTIAVAGVLSALALCSLGGIIHNLDIL